MSVPAQAKPDHPALLILEANHKIERLSREIEERKTDLDNAKIALDRAVKELGKDGLGNATERLFHMKHEKVVVRLRRQGGAPGQGFEVDVLPLIEVERA